MTKIHILADETLGGIKREYVEVDRKAEVGEKIVIASRRTYDDRYENGDVFTVSDVWEDREGDVGGRRSPSFRYNEIGLIYRNEYHVLEPTDIVHIDGQRYEMVCRVAKVGDRIIVTKSHDFPKGFVSTVKGYDELIKLEDAGYGAEQFLDPANEAYRVLVPVKTAEADEPQSVDPIFAIGNVAQEVAKLKRTIEYLENEIDTLHKDNRTLGEELARLKEGGDKPQPNADMLAEAFAALKRVGL
ncbi:hypothetical protein 268TH002_79 [Bacillus phage 268TH002]|nr:hypothetical protein 268TH007_83 [Bacillus phage 268TH007]URO01874.1 hypothetical protein 268TH002_79 [Bacillus phage 268TH002]